MDYKLILNLSIKAGEIMLRSGAETYRVEDTMNYILRTACTESFEATVTMTSIAASISNPDMEPITMIKRVHERGTNLNRIMKVNELSRAYCGGNMTAAEAYAAMKEMGGKQYRTWLYNAATVVITAGFSPLFGGGALEMCGAALVGAVLSLIMTFGKKLQINGFILDALSSMGVALAAKLLQQVIPSLNGDVVIISSIMPLVPGVAITNAVRDTLQGDYVSGGARILEAFLKAAAVALGVGVGIAIMTALFKGGVLL